MKAVLIELLKKLVVYFLFIIIVFTLTYSFVTGEFPPKISKIRSSIQEMRQQIDQIKKLQQAASEKLLNQDLNIESQIAATNQANDEALKTIEKAFIDVSKSNSVSNEHYLKIYNELQNIKGQLNTIENRLDRIERSDSKGNPRPYPVIK